MSGCSCNQFVHSHDVQCLDCDKVAEKVYMCPHNVQKHVSTNHRCKPKGAGGRRR